MNIITDRAKMLRPGNLGKTGAKMPFYAHAIAISMLLAFALMCTTRKVVRISNAPGVDGRQINIDGPATFRHLSVLRLTKVAW